MSGSWPTSVKFNATQLFLQLLVDFVKLTAFDSFKISGLLECLIFCYLCVPWFTCAPASSVSAEPFIRKFVFEMVSQSFFSGLNLVTCVKLLTHIEHVPLGSSYSFWLILWNLMASPISRSLVFGMSNFLLLCDPASTCSFLGPSRDNIGARECRLLVEE